MEPRLKDEINRCLKQGDISAMENLLRQQKVWEKESLILYRLIGIYKEERFAEERYTVFFNAGDVDRLVEHFVWLKLLVRRLEFELPAECCQELYFYCKNRRVSVYQLASILETNIFRQAETCRRLALLYAENEGEQSERAGYFWRLLQEIKEADKKDGK